MRKLYILFILCILNTILFSATRSITETFNLNRKVFDYGQNIISLEIQIGKLKNVDEKSLEIDTFRVHAKGELPKVKGKDIFPVLDEKTKALGLFDVDREITKVYVNDKGNIVIELKYGQNIPGSGTLAYITGEVSRNVLMDLTYTVIQEKDFRLKNGTVISKKSVYKQGKVVDEEADKFISKISSNGINYQYYTPENTVKSKKYPLIIWFHGNGEGGYKEYRNNVSQKLANRGVVAFGEEETQRIFGGAYVIAPQVDDTWYNNYSKGYIGKIKVMIEDIVAKNSNIDRNRIYIFGASAGGYMSIRMGIEYPGYFAGINVSAPAVNLAPERGGVATTEEEMKKLVQTPLWLVHAENDPTVDYSRSSKWIYEKTKDKGVLLSVYPNVKIDETEYNGHWSWIYSLRNMPVNNKEENLFQWMSKQNLKK